MGAGLQADIQSYKQTLGGKVTKQDRHCCLRVHEGDDYTW